MKIIKATKKHSKEISKLMLLDLENPNPKFPREMINNFREHAKEENIIKEFENPRLIAFLVIEGRNVVGFIVGYEQGLGKAMIHYINAKENELKERLLKRFIKECKSRNITRITTDTFEFMKNNAFFKSQGFTLMKKESLTKNLEILWHKLDLN